MSRSNITDKNESYTIAEVAQIEKCTPVTIRREIARGNIKAYRIGRLIRIKASDLEKARRPVTNAATLRGHSALPENATQ